MSAYTINYSNPENTNAIVIAEGTIDRSTSLGLIGRNAAGFGTSIDENFLHLLENFTSPLQPVNPVLGQLWYDISQGAENQILRVYDNNTWTELGGVTRSAIEPSNKRMGDLWVDTTFNQLKMWLGSEPWLVIGPNVSTTSQTGAYPELVADTSNPPVNHLVIKNYVDGDVITIVSQSKFTPASVISGFDTIYPGVNLTNNKFNGVTAIFNGLAARASALTVSVPAAQTVPANSFFRKDIPQSLSEVLTINNDSGINIGLTSSTFLIGKQSRDGIITNTADQSNIKFNIYKSGSPNTILTIAGQTQRIGINQVNPEETLHVNGTVKIVGSTTINNVLSVNSSTSINAGLSVIGITVISNTATITALKTNNISVQSTTTLANIGSQDVGFDTLFVKLISPPTGSTGTGVVVNGTANKANRLSGNPTIAVSGQGSSLQIPFNGSTNIAIPISLNNTAIDGQDTTSTALTNYMMPVTNPDTASLYKITKQDFLSEVTPKLIEPGYIMQSAFISTADNSLNGAPPGWVWCDGANYPSYGVTNSLYQALMQMVPDVVVNGVLVAGPPPYGPNTPNSPSFNVPLIPDVTPTGALINPNTSVQYVIRYMIKL